MVVQHNLPAMNSHRQLSVNTAQTSKNLEKLSSGYRINRAGDDAAGLAISEKMRGQIRGLDMATQNAQNGVSLIQTAEGGLNETHSILQRMRELADQSANGTYTDDDRANINKEVQALKDEVDRISSSTQYNGINLLDGTMGAKSVASIKPADLTTTLGDLGLTSSANGIVLTAAGKDYEGQSAKLVVTEDQTMTMQIGDKTYKLASAATPTTDDNGVTVAEDKTFVDSDGNAIAELNTKFASTAVKGAGVVTIASASTAADSIAGNAAKNMIATEKSQVVFQIGANGTADQKVGLHVGNMSTGVLGSSGTNNNTYIGGNKVIDVDVSTREKANESIKVLDDAINQVSGARADFGALQNRLEHTIANLGTTSENLQAAESSIRDVDMAKEMMDFTKNNILTQASQAMLAQSNTLPEGTLQLLQ